MRFCACRSPCGSVDRNQPINPHSALELVAPPAGAWIETPFFGAAEDSGASLPLRERGSKPGNPALFPRRSKSLPLRERGSKLPIVWGERAEVKVAPPAGAWIETPEAATTRARLVSLPLRERGSKLAVAVAVAVAARRSPCGSVDRNTIEQIEASYEISRSPCGSVDRNSSEGREGHCDGLSLPLRERGSKHSAIGTQPCGRHVAPPAGAWIETPQPPHPAQSPPVAPPAGAWIETGEG